MPNPYFRFKQFTVYHDRCAMKVGTDGVLLGAWVDVTHAQRILDIGTGSGLIALMLAQRSTATLATIGAIDIDREAFEQARQNIVDSPWPHRVQAYHCSLQRYAEMASTHYDLLVANPPFFQVTPTPATSARSTARQSHYLSPDDLLCFSSALLGETGRLAVIYPVETAEDFLRLAVQYGFTCSRTLQVKPKHHLPVKRTLLELTRCKMSDLAAYQQDTLVIEEDERYQYTPQFIDLIKDFYLKY
ncbi:MAG: methyltransferase [Chloroflexota bacterium]